MWIKVGLIDSVVVAGFNSPEIREPDDIQRVGVELMRLVDAASETKRLLVSFKGIRFMSSAMIGKLVLLNKCAKSKSVELRFCDVAPNVLEVFNITRLNRVFRIFRDPDDHGPGNAGVFAKLPKRPNSGGTHAEPPREDGTI
ncbi:MAG: STAS domain-containing protein [Planctomycetaceae bacterium]|nr:STAS domain-containing protein [Planctomycetales bacterium]MCB9921272.1 STAS domain-containing protein [Planctomycetaceae bacterium]